MLRAKRLDNDGVASLKAKPKRQTIPDPELRGHYIRITPSGSKSFWVVARDNHGKQVWRMIGSPPMSIDDARASAQKTIRAIRSTTVIEAANDTSFESVASAWFQRHIVKNGLSAAHTRMTRDMLRRHIVPAFAGMNFVDVRRKHVSALLDKVEDDCGARTADYALSTITGICTWYAKRDEDYASPIIKGMKRCTTPDRDRILTEAEVRELWSADGFEFLSRPSPRRARPPFPRPTTSRSTASVRPRPRSKRGASAASSLRLRMPLVLRKPMVTGCWALELRLTTRSWKPSPKSPEHGPDC
jgi:hypothetical protein